MSYQRIRNIGRNLGCLGRGSIGRRPTNLGRSADPYRTDLGSNDLESRGEFADAESR